MESQRRLYFKKQIVKQFSQQKTEVPTSAENEFSNNNEADEDCVVTLLGSQSYYDQNQKFAFVNTIPSNPDNSNVEKESQNDDDSTKALLEDITNKDLAKEKSYTKNIEDIRIDIEFESTENTEEVWNKENSSDTFPQKENDDDDKLISINEKNYKENESELLSTLTEVIPEGEMELLRKSLEPDEDDIEVENNKSKKRNKRSKINKNYVDYLSEEEDFVWDSSSWNETGDESSSDESNEPQKKKRKVRAEDGKVGEAGLKKKKKNKRKEAKKLARKRKRVCEKRRKHCKCKIT
ncbi:unnamed protein product, partial [Brenthis ino]